MEHASATHCYSGAAQRISLCRRRYACAAWQNLDLDRLAEMNRMHAGQIAEGLLPRTDVPFDLSTMPRPPLSSEVPILLPSDVPGGKATGQSGGVGGKRAAAGMLCLYVQEPGSGFS